MKTSIIIVNYKTQEVLADCISSVLKYEGTLDLEIIIVDNSSTETSASAIKQLTAVYNNVKAIYLNELKSFSFANNRGIEIAQGDYILIMNPDIIFENPLIEYLAKFLQNNKDTAAIAPALIGKDDKFQRYYYLKYPTILQFIFFHSIILRLFFRNPFFINRFLIESKISTVEKNIYHVQQIPGAFIFTTRNVLDEIGLLDENFMLFFEDVDISYRMHKKYKLAIDTSIYVRHLGGTSFKEIEWWVYGRFIASMIYFFRKHYAWYRYLILKLLSRANARCMLLIEHIFGLFGKENKFRIEKYNNFLKLSKDI